MYSVPSDVGCVLLVGDRDRAERREEVVDQRLLSDGNPGF